MFLFSTLDLLAFGCAFQGLLLARDDLDGGWFGQSVVLLFEHKDTEGTMGIILNRPTRATLGQLVKNTPLELSSKLSSCLDLPVSLGGPVDTASLLVVSNKEVAGAQRIVDGLYVLGIVEAADNMQRGLIERDDVHLYMGYSGWAPWQLTEEIKQGGWWCGAADVSTVLARPRLPASSAMVGVTEALGNDAAMWADLKTRIGL